MSDAGPTVFNGRYELHRRLGRGGMAEVYLARDQLLDRPVAVKVLFPEFATDPAFVERFRREATAAANLNHPNIVGVYDWGEADSTYFIVMEYVDGRTLAEILRTEGPLHPDRVADIGADVAAALGFAHRNGVVHRDVKPGNVIVTSTGLVKVADFGIARAITASTEDDLTQVGQVMGTAAYFSPEQARGENVDPRSDIYSLGVVLYELATGRPPFAGDSPVAIAYKHVHESPVPPRQVDPTLPQALEAIILKTLAKNPANRYPSAEDLRADLRRFREGNRILAEPVMPPPVDPGATGVLPATEAVGATVAAPVAEAYYEEDDEEPRRSGLFLAALVVLLVLLAGMLFLLARALGLGQDDEPAAATVEVPRVIGLPVEEAIEILEGEGFDVDTVEEPNEDFEAGIVFDQDPVGGFKAEEGSTVTLKVSAGVEQIPVPDVVGSQIDDARRLLEGEGFRVREEPIPSEDVPVGEVVSQDPPGGELAPRSSEVVLQVSSGPEERPVPEIQPGSTVSAASSLLGQNGFTVDERSQPHESIPEGRVIGTDPPAGTPLPRGATVTLIVSSGPPTVEVPNLDNLTESGAQSAVQNRNLAFRPETTTDCDPSRNGRVVGQSPSPGTAVQHGTTVTAQICQAAPPTDGGDGGDGDTDGP
ncbi:MAG TPA: Stk1 family PASTA domain-containing Ser/Thr kinase [Acidimicrobiales bacterium]|nr:Stk1 family PASTA domain-containing Ser/Thr kinase [Acidimicrobiales bacterium]